MSRSLMIGKDIIGKARTPILWDKAFKEFSINEKVEVRNRILYDSSEVGELMKLKDFLILGYPNKLIGAQFSEIKNNSESLFGFNLIKRNRASLEIKGFNFDGIAFYLALKGVIENTNIHSSALVIYGKGSTSRVIESTLRKQTEPIDVYHLSRFGQIIQTNSSEGLSGKRHRGLIQRLREYNSRIFVNATPVGKFSIKVDNQIFNIVKNVNFDFVFDLNYGKDFKPQFFDLDTKLGYTDGKNMNLIQAALGFRECYMSDSVSTEDIISCFKKFDN